MGERRRQIAEIIARHEPICSRTMSTRSVRRAADAGVGLDPGASFYVTSFANALRRLTDWRHDRAGAVRNRLINAVRATGWMASPIMAEVVGAADA